MQTDIVVHMFICTQNIAQCCHAFFTIACVITLVTRLHGCRLWHCRKLYCIDAYFHAGQFAGKDRHNAWWQLFSMMGEILFMWLLFHFCSFHFPLFIITSAQLHCTSCSLADLYDGCRDFGHSWYTGLSVMLCLISPSFAECSFVLRSMYFRRLCFKVTFKQRWYATCKYRLSSPGSWYVHCTGLSCMVVSLFYLYFMFHIAINLLVAVAE